MRIVLLLDWHLYYTIQLANALVSDNSVLLITRDHNYEISSYDNPISLDNFLLETLDNRIAIEKLHYKRSSYRNLFEINRIRKAISGFNPDAIHIQETVDWRIVLIAALHKSKNIVVTVHDVVSHLGESHGVQRFLWYILLKLANKIIVHGGYLKRQFNSEYPRLSKYREINVIPHGVYSIYQNWDDELVKEEENTILFFGRITKYKGIDVLIKAEPIISKKIPNVRIIIAGKGEELSKYENLIMKKGCFEIHNRFISNAEVPKFFRRAAVVVLPYTEASQSGIIPIAYVFGKPVVVTNVGSIPEVVENGKTGFIVPTHSPEDLGNAIIKILKNQELKKTMSKNALAMASTNLSWSNIAKETEEIYSLS